jgi:hypothetical protein
MFFIATAHLAGFGNDARYTCGGRCPQRRPWQAICTGSVCHPKDLQHGLRPFSDAWVALAFILSNRQQGLMNIPTVEIDSGTDLRHRFRHQSKGNVSHMSLRYS